MLIKLSCLPARCHLHLGSVLVYRRVSAVLLQTWSLSKQYSYDISERNGATLSVLFYFRLYIQVSVTPQIHSTFQYMSPQENLTYV